MKRAHILAVVLLTLGWLRGTPGAAQVSVAADAGLYSAYVWRGVTYTNRFVIQPDISVTFPVRRLSLMGQLWANVEPARYDAFGDISEAGGTSSIDVTEFDWVGELGVPVSAKTTFTLGATGYVFPNSSGLTNESNSVEVYGRAEVAGPFNPTASVYYDVGIVKGAYLEAGLSRELQLNPRTSLTLGALAGFSAGQDAALDADGEPQAESFNFEKNGFTHAELWTTLDFAIRKVAVSPTLHVIVTGDEATKFSKVERDPATDLPRLNRTGAKLWFGVTLGWTR